MATYTIYYRSNDPHSPMNGEHTPVESGAAFIAAYPEAEPELGDLSDTARMVGEMPVGDTLRFWFDGGEVDITRVS